MSIALEMTTPLALCGSRRHSLSLRLSFAPSWAPEPCP